MLMPSGFRWKKDKLGDGTITWELRRHREVVASGVAESVQDADKKLKKALGEQATVISKRLLDRSRLQQKMKRYIEKRIHLFSYVMNEAANGVGVNDICAAAKAGEQDWHDREKERVGFTWPLSTHHSVTPAHEAAMAIIKLMKGLGLTKRGKILSYAKRHLGDAFLQATGINVAELEAEALKAQEEDDARDARAK